MEKEFGKCSFCGEKVEICDGCGKEILKNSPAIHDENFFGYVHHYCSPACFTYDTGEDYDPVYEVEIN